MDRNHVLNLMSELRLRGMRASYDEVLADGARRKHPPQRIVAALLEVEVADKKSPLDSVSDDNGKAADGQRHQRL